MLDCRGTLELRSLIWDGTWGVVTGIVLFLNHLTFKFLSVIYIHINFDPILFSIRFVRFFEPS